MRNWEKKLRKDWVSESFFLLNKRRKNNLKDNAKIATKASPNVLFIKKNMQLKFWTFDSMHTHTMHTHTFDSMNTLTKSNFEHLIQCTYTHKHNKQKSHHQRVLLEPKGLLSGLNEVKKRWLHIQYFMLLCV